jgi:hypothetical protein
VVRQATVTDEAGTEVDLSEFLGGDDTPEIEDVEDTQVVESEDATEAEAGDAPEATDEAGSESTEPESAPAKA